MTATIEYKTYTAHAKQKKFHHSVAKNRIVLFNGGRGSGKTAAGAIQAFLEAVQNQPGQPGLIVASTYDELRKAPLAEFLKWTPRHLIKRMVKSPHIEIELVNGTLIQTGSADKPNSLRGPNKAWVWIDEPRNIPTREAFDIVSGQIRQGNEKMWLTTTPAGVFHWLYELFIANPLQNSTYVTASTDENPHTSEAFKDQLRSQYVGRFADQELDADFVSFEGLIYDNFSLDENIEAMDYVPEWYTYWGVDDGYAHGDGVGSAGYHPRVILIAQQRPDGGFNIVDEYVRTLELPEKSIDTVLQDLPYDLPVLTQVDSSAAELRRRLSDYGIVNNGATHRVEDGIKVVRRYICDGHGVRQLKIHPRCANLIREMQTYRYDDRGSVVYAGERKPMKMDDHSADALRYLLWNFK